MRQTSNSFKNQLPKSRLNIHSQPNFLNAPGLNRQETGMIGRKRSYWDPILLLEFPFLYLA